MLKSSCKFAPHSVARSILIVVLAAAAAAGAAQSSETVVEPLSGTPFLMSLLPPAGEAEQRLTSTGMGERTILFIGVHLYTFGLSVDADGARATLGGFAGRSGAELAGECPALLSATAWRFAMSLRLAMVRTVAGRDVANALDEALRPRMAAAAQAAEAVIRKRWSSFAAISMCPRSRLARRSCLLDLGKPSAMQVVMP